MKGEFIMMTSNERLCLHIPPQHEIFQLAKEEAERLMAIQPSTTFITYDFKHHQSLSYYLFERLILETARILHENGYVIMPIETRDSDLRMKLTGICFKKLSASVETA